VTGASAPKLYFNVNTLATDSGLCIIAVKGQACNYQEGHDGLFQTRELGDCGTVDQQSAREPPASKHAYQIKGNRRRSHPEIRIGLDVGKGLLMRGAVTGKRGRMQSWKTKGA
jgi:hypothetical protein